MAENPYKNPPDNPVECPCCRAASHWDTVYEKGWNAGASWVALFVLFVGVVLAGIVVLNAYERGLISVPAWKARAK